MWNPIPKHCTAGDPKFWPGYIKHIIMADIVAFVFMGNMYLTGVTTGFPQLAEEFQRPIPELSDQISWGLLALGLGSLIWMPFALCLGKRPVVIVSMIFFLAGSIWSFKATSYNSLLGSRILALIGAGSIETLGAAIVADLFLERWFSTALAFFAFFFTAGTQLGPLIAGYLIQSNGWRWFFKLCSIIIGFNLLTTVFLLPETTYRRQTYDGETAAEVDRDIMAKAEGAPSIQQAENVEASNVPNELNELNGPYAGSYFKDLFQFRNRGLEEQGMREWLPRFLEPFQFLAVPQILFASLSFGLLVGGLVIIGTLTPSLLAPPPYNFTSSGLGLFAMTSLVGCVVIYPLAGPLTDMISRYITRRSGGVHLPEHRIPALVFPFVIAPPGLILFANILASHRNFYIAGVGYGMQSVGAVLVPSVVLSFVIDAYPKRSGEALVLIVALKQVVVFACAKAIPTWLRNEGIKKMFVQMASIQWAILFLALPLYFVSPWLRAKSLRFL